MVRMVRVGDRYVPAHEAGGIEAVSSATKGSIPVAAKRADLPMGAHPLAHQGVCNTSAKIRKVSDSRVMT